MTTAHTAARSGAKNPPTILVKPAPKSRKRAIGKAAAAAKPDDLTAIRNALPFFKPGRGKVETSWWNVTPSGNYAVDLETGKAYARAFLPVMTFNAGASTLGTIVSDMAKAGRDPIKNPKSYRHIDAVALGFLMQIGGILQSAMASIGVATIALKDPKSDLGEKFIALVESGELLRGTNRSTLFHDPNASIFSVSRQ